MSRPGQVSSVPPCTASGPTAPCVIPAEAPTHRSREGVRRGLPPVHPQGLVRWNDNLNNLELPPVHPQGLRPQIPRALIPKWSRVRRSPKRPHTPSFPNDDGFVAGAAQRVHHLRTVFRATGLNRELQLHLGNLHF